MARADEIDRLIAMLDEFAATQIRLVKLQAEIADLIGEHATAARLRELLKRYGDRVEADNKHAKNISAE